MIDDTTSPQTWPSGEQVATLDLSRPGMLHLEADGSEPRAWLPPSANGPHHRAPYLRVAWPENSPTNRPHADFLRLAAATCPKDGGEG